jgi:hypothetical protein
MFLNRPFALTPLQRKADRADNAPGRFPDSWFTAFSAFPGFEKPSDFLEKLPIYSGATVRELHPVPYYLPPFHGKST